MRNVYLITAIQNDLEDSPIYKIGVSKFEKGQRSKQLQTGNANDLKVIHKFKSEFPFKLETALHNYFKCKHYNREWFSLNTNDVNGFLNTCEKYENNFKILKDAGNPFI